MVPLLVSTKPLRRAKIWKRTAFIRIVAAIFFGVLLYAPNARADSPAALIRVEKEDVLVELVHTGQVQLSNEETGLIVWGEGDRESWQIFSSHWSRPGRSSADAFGFDRWTASRGETAHATGSSDLGQLTTQLAQIRSPDVFRDTATIVAPYQGATVLDPKVTLRRDPGEGDEILPAVEAVILRGRDEVVRIPFSEGQSVIRWHAIPNLPDELKEGLPPGGYQFRLPNATGLGVARFVVLGTETRDELLRREQSLGHLLKDATHPLYIQVVVESLIDHEPPLLCDALDLLDSLAEDKHTSRLASLKQHVVDRLQEPSRPPGLPPGLGEPTGDAVIDEVRALIAAGRWDRAIAKLDEEATADSVEGRRKDALVELYRGVILSESGAGREQEATVAFRKAIALLQSLPHGTEDLLYRAHNNYANFLLGRAQDQLHNHAFQMAAGVRLPLLRALYNWIEAREHYKAALDFAGSPQQTAAVQLNLARQYALLADIIRTLAHPEDPEQRFHAAERSAARHAGKLLQDVIDWASIDQSDPFVAAVSEELLAQLAFRRDDIPESLIHAHRASQLHLDAGSLEGMESISRLLGLTIRRPESGASAEEALQHFLISERLSDILRDRYPADQIGLSRAGFFARRAYVTQHIVELLAGEGRYAEALYHIEKGKARSLQDTLAARRITAEEIELQHSDDLLLNWPKDTVALTYFLGSERSWVFYVDSSGKTCARVLNGADGRPISSRELVSRIRLFLNGMDYYARGQIGRLRAQGFDKQWPDELSSFREILLPDEVLELIGQAKLAVIVPHHILHYFPFAALVTESDSRDLGKFDVPQPRFLVDEPVNLIYAPSLAVWRGMRRQPASGISRAAAAGIVDFPGTDRLDGVAAELDGVRRHLQPWLVEILEERNATKSAVSGLLQQDGLLLLAMHGINHADRPLESHLLMFPGDEPDGRLTAEAIFRRPVSTDLIVMSACYSGLADRSPLQSDDLFGIQRALLSSGAKTIVSGLWDVFDKTAPDLVGSFHERLAQGDSAAAALANSQRAFLEKYRSTGKAEPYLHPYFWAVYTVAGDDRTSVSRDEAPETVAKPLVAVSPEQISEQPEVNPENPEELVAADSRPSVKEDADFDRLVDFQMAEQAFSLGNAALLTDFALQLADAERVLGRAHVSGLTPGPLLALAARMAAVNSDQETLERLSKASHRFSDERLQGLVTGLAKIDDVTGTSVAGLTVPLESTDLDTLIAMQSLATAIRKAELLGNADMLAMIEQELNDTPTIAAEQKAALLRLLDTAQQVVADHGDDEASEAARMVAKLVAASRSCICWATTRGGVCRCHQHHQAQHPHIAASIRAEILVNGRPIPFSVPHGATSLVSSSPRAHVTDVFPAMTNGILQFPVLGDEYGIRITNQGRGRIVVLTSVDGLNVMNGRPATDRDSGYVLRPGQSYVITGWRMDNQRVKAFTVTERSASEAAALGMEHHTGHIRITAIAERAPQIDHGIASFAPNARALAGTGTGRERESRVTIVQFQRGHSTAVVHIRYGLSPESLQREKHEESGPSER